MLQAGSEFIILWAIWLVGTSASLWLIYDAMVKQRRMPAFERAVWVLAALFFNFPVIPVLIGTIFKIGLVMLYFVRRRDML